jgi:PTS system N-acetylglucosamine-specific IIC component
MDALHVRLGYGFSAGLFDYVLNFGKAARPLLLLPVGLAYFALYYGLFRVFIVRFDLKTPGREDDPVGMEVASRAPADGIGEAFVQALGGPGNLIEVGACTTRLRLDVVDPKAIDEAALRRLGAKGLISPSEGALQVILGPTAELTAGEIRAWLVRAPRTEPIHRPDIRPALSSSTAEAPCRDVSALLKGLGGAANVTAIGTASSRLRVEVKDQTCVDASVLKAWGARAVATPGGGVVHIVVGPGAEALAGSIEAALELSETALAPSRSGRP